MNTRKNGDMIQLIILLLIMIYYYGISYTLNIIYNIFKIMNIILVQTFNSSLLSLVFKYGITFAIVGLLLIKMNSPRGRLGHIIGKILYVIVGVIVNYILNCVSKCIF